MTDHRLLLVEDEFLIRLTLAESLTDEGYEVVEADSAQSALAALAAGGEIDVMLTDINLPGGLDGRALAVKARETRPTLPVMFMSGAADPAPSGHPLDYYIHKPYSPSAVSAMVRRVLAHQGKGPGADDE